MKYLDTAFGQLAFAWKLYNHGLEGKLNLSDLDKPITFQEGNMVFVLPDKILDSEDDLIIALANNLGIAFDAAAITLNRCREEAGITGFTIVVKVVRKTPQHFGLLTRYFSGAM